MQQVMKTAFGHEFHQNETLLRRLINERPYKLNQVGTLQVAEEEEEEEEKKEEEEGEKKEEEEEVKQIISSVNCCLTSASQGP